MRKSREFSAFGRRWRTKQWAAVEASAAMGKCQDLHPLEILKYTEAYTEAGEWVALTSQDAVNAHVRDVTGMLIPKVALDGLCGLVTSYTYGFLQDWKGVRIPPRFKSGADYVSSEASDPLISQVIQEGLATMKELEEYYSLEDAFKMFDISMAKSVNAALANEAAAEEAKSK